MDINAVPQEGNTTLAGHRKALYARGPDGRIVVVPSAGWEAEEIVTTHAVRTLQARADAARERVRAGLASPLEYWMNHCRMDVALLAQTSGFWQWQVRRHLRPGPFASLSDKQAARYAQALGVTTDELCRLP